MQQQRFKELIEKYLDESAQLAEKQELTAMLEEPANLNLLDNLIIEQLASRSYKFDLTPTLRHSINQYILQKTAVTASTPPSAHRIHFLKTAWFRYAAAIIILITGAAILYIQYNHNKSFNPLNHSSRQVADVAPGRDRAILTLANGQQIILDSTQGDIVKQEGLTVVNLAGKLKYEGVGTSDEYNTISTPKGGQYQIVLPDGSKVWLNAASSIKFPTAFIGNTRHVEMMGEAYMEIAKNPKQSFVVRANGAEIQVLGTSFNVNAYEDESAVKTTLIDGSIKLISAANSSMILKPGQQAIVASNQELKIVNNADMEQALAWKNGVFRFNQVNLEEVMRQLTRWYDIDVVYENGIPSIRLRGEIERNLTLSQVLDGLEELGVKFRMEGRRLIILQ